MEEKKKSNKGLIFVIVILILSIISLLMFILVDKDIISLGKKNDTQAVEKDKKNENNAEENRILTTEEARKVLVEFGFTGANGPVRRFRSDIYREGYTDSFKVYNVLASLYDKAEKNITCQDLITDTNVKYELNGDQYTIDGIGYCTNNSANSAYPHADRIVKYEDANKLYKQMYGKDLAKASIVDADEIFFYSEKYNGFTKLSCNCGGTFGPYVHVEKIKDATIEDSKLTINYYNEVFSATTDNPAVTYAITDKNGNPYSEATMTNAQIAEDIINNRIDAVSLYTIVFDINEDGTYKLVDFYKSLK